MMLMVYFLDIYTSLFEDTCPLKQLRVKRKYITREPLFTSGIPPPLSINQSYCVRNWINQTDKTSKNYCRIFNALKRAAKANYYIDILNKHKNDITNTWTVLRQAISKQK